MTLNHGVRQQLEQVTSALVKQALMDMAADWATGIGLLKKTSYLVEQEGLHLGHDAED